MEIAGYELGQVIHVGRHGPLWETRTPEHSALLAIRSAHTPATDVRRWKSWARITSRHVAHLLDVARSDDGRWAIVQERISGRPLDLELNSPDLRPIATRRAIALGILAGVRALHQVGIVHGDLTPANILITPQGRPVLVDLIDIRQADEITPGWTQGPPTKEGDIECVRHLAQLLRMGDAIEEALAAPHEWEEEEPPETPIVREPLDPNQVIRDLRAAALREVTAEKSPTPTPKKRNPIPLIISGVLCLLLIGGGGFYVMSGRHKEASQTTPAPISTQEIEQSDAVASCDPNELMALIQGAINARDQAMTTLNEADLPSVIGGELLADEQLRLENLRASDTNVETLKSRIHDVSVTECDPGRIQAHAILEVTEVRTCTGGNCSNQPLPAPQELSVTIDPVARLITQAFALTNNSQSG